MNEAPVALACCRPPSGGLTAAGLRIVSEPRERGQQRRQNSEAEGRGKVLSFPIQQLKGQVKSSQLKAGSWTAATALALASACGAPTPSSTLSAVPALDTSVLGPAVREQIDEALAAAAAGDDADAQGALGMVLQAYEFPEAAVVAYSRAVDLAPEVFRWRYLKARALASAGQQVEALAVLEECLGDRPDHLPSLLASGGITLELGELAAAQSQFSAAGALDVTSVAARYGLARTLRAKGETAAALAAYSEVLDLAPRFGAAHYAVGLLYRELGEGGLAAEHLELAEGYLRYEMPQRDPLMAAVLELRSGASDLTRSAVRLHAAGQAVVAIEKLLEAVDRDPEFVPARVQLIALLSEAARYQEAERHYRAAIAVSPNAQLVRFNFARSLLRQGRLVAAAEELRRVVEINPHVADAQALLGSLLDDRGRWEEASKHYERALATVPRHPQANLMMAIHQIRQGRFEQASAFTRRLLLSDTDSLAILVYRLAIAYRKAGERGEEVDLLRRARVLAVASGRSALVAEIDRGLATL